MTAEDEGNTKGDSRRDEGVDEEDEESFPASDPPSSWAGPGSDPEE